MFHVEHQEINILQEYCANSKKAALLSLYAHHLHDLNRYQNLTGHSELDDIIKNLIVGSLDPLRDLNVPRGTPVLDMGTGAGIPGFPLAVYHESLLVACLDSNARKTRVLETFISEQGINNCNVLNMRVEDLVLDPVVPGGYPFIVSRAMAHPFAVAELGAGLLSDNGYLYIYANNRTAQGDDIFLRHLDNLGLVEVPNRERSHLGIGNTGYLFKNNGPMKKGFPRRYPAIKRDIKRFYRV